jgi:PAS domain S-box-containing protein
MSAEAAFFHGPFTVDQRAVLDALPDGVFVTDNAGNIYDVNRAFCEMMESTRAELAGLHISACVDAEDLRRRPPRMDEFQLLGSIHSQRLFRRKGGSVFWGDFRTRKLNESYAITVVRNILLEPFASVPNKARDEA